MRTSLTVAAIALLFLLALLPWIVASCSPEPLLPPALANERVHYEQTADVIRTATMQVERARASTIELVVLGTLPPSRTPILSPATPTLTLSAALPPSETPAATEQPTSEVTLRTMTPAVTPLVDVTAIVVVIESTPIPQSSPVAHISPTGEPAGTARTTASPTPHGVGLDLEPTRSLPSGLVQVTDVITERQLEEQFLEHEDAGMLEGLQISITADGLRASGRVVVNALLRPRLESEGSFTVHQDSLVVEVTSVTLNGKDATSRYAFMIEDRANWSLYQLLPQRYVQSFEAAEGQIAVQSLARSR